MCVTYRRLSYRAAKQLKVPKAPWSAVAADTAFPLGIQGGSFAAAVQGASRIFMQRGEVPQGGSSASCAAALQRRWLSNENLRSGTRLRCTGGCFRRRAPEEYPAPDEQGGVGAPGECDSAHHS